MAHFAELDENNMVVQVIVVNNSELIDSNGNEQELLGTKFCESLMGGRWIQTSYNSSFRKNFAGIGYFYDSESDAFIPPKPYPSWILDSETFSWNAPTSSIDNGMAQKWDEDTKSWVSI